MHGLHYPREVLSALQIFILANPARMQFALKNADKAFERSNIRCRFVRLRDLSCFFCVFSKRRLKEASGYKFLCREVALKMKHPNSSGLRAYHGAYGPLHTSKALSLKPLCLVQML